MKKRLLAVLLTAVMLLGMIPFAASAEGKDPFVVEIESKAATKGDETVALKVTVPENSGVWGVRVYLCYDKDLTIGDVNNVTCGDMFTAEPSIFVDAIDRDSIEWAESYSKIANLFKNAGVENTGYNMACIAFDGENDDSVVTAADGTLLATVEFTVNGDAESYEVFALVDPVDVFKYENGNFVDYDIECIPGVITFEEAVDPDPKEAQLVVSDAEVTAGEVAEFTLNVVNNPGALYSISGYVGYDKPMSLVSFALGDDFSDFSCMSPMKNAKQRDIDLDDMPNYAHTKRLKQYYEAAGLTTENKRASYFMAETDDVEFGASNDGVFVKFSLDTTGLAPGEYDITFVLDPDNSYHVDYSVLEVTIVHGTLKISAHEHEWELTDSKEATCTVDGYETYTCKVGGETRTDILYALGHDMQVVNTVDPTCTKTGTETSECSRHCGEEGWQEVKTLEAKGHGEFTSNIVEPNCETGGYTEHTCTVCNGEEEGGYYTDTETNALGHDWVQDEVTGSCGEYGTVHYHCSRCDKTKEEQGAYIDHNWVEQEDKRVEPTCTVPGSAHYVCSRCQEENDEVLEATGHDFDSVKTPATCTKQGYTTYTCKKCNGEEPGGSYVSDYVNATGHDLKIVKTDAETCLKDGKDYYECSRNCGEEGWQKEEVRKALGHDMKLVRTVDPTCTENGAEYYECSRNCGEEGCKEEKTINKLGHNYKDEVTAPTCTKQGYTTHTCSRCDSTYVDTYVEPNGHEYEVIVIAPTCTKGGCTVHICSVCEGEEPNGYYIDSEVEPNGHKYEDTVVPPTCTEDGYTSHLCSVCEGEEEGGYYEDEVVPSLGGHAWGEPVFTWAEDGKSATATFTCENDPAHVETVEATVTSEVTTPATEDENGTTTYTAAVEFEGETYTDTLELNDIPALGSEEEPTITPEGAWISGSNSGLTFGINNTSSTPATVTVDGKVLSEDDYTINEDGTITLSPEFLATLSVGDHTIVVTFADDSEAEAKFTITASASTDEDDKKEEGAPQTGDTNAIVFWMFIAVVSLVGAVSVVVVMLPRKRYGTRK